MNIAEKSICFSIYQLTAVIFTKCLRKKIHPWLNPHVMTPISYLCPIPLLPGFHPHAEPVILTFMSLAASGIKPGPSVLEYSTLPTELRNARKNAYLFLTYIIKVHLHFMLNFNLSPFIIKYIALIS